MNNILITDIKPNEVNELKIICTKTFDESFGGQNSTEDMQNYLKLNFSDEKLKGELSNQNSRFYFAKIVEQVIGYLKINFGDAQTEIKDNHSLEIERIYVLNEFQRSGVGRLFLQHSIDEAKKNKCDYLWLGVWEENLKAINFYKKNGFVEFGKHIFQLGSSEQTDIMMKLNL